MATKFSDIMGNYKDMSVADLGSSLLQRKEEMQREAVKAAKKNARVEKALGLLLAGQTVFKGAFKRRAKELDSAYQFQIADNESQSKEINMLAKLTNPMYQWSETVKDKTFANDEEKLDSFVASEFFDPFRISVNNYTEPAFKQMMGDKFESFSNQSAYFNTQVEAAKDYARHYLKDDNYKTGYTVSAYNFEYYPPTIYSIDEVIIIKSIRDCLYYSGYSFENINTVSYHFQ